MYLHDWKSFFDMVMNFEYVFITKGEFEATEPPYDNVKYWHENKAKAQAALNDPKYAGIEILLASYSYENYSGDAFVLFRKDGRLYEVNGSHCSCYGLEGQWEPEETTVEALRHRLDAGQLGSDEYSSNIFASELRLILGAFEDK